MPQPSLLLEGKKFMRVKARRFGEFTRLGPHPVLRRLRACDLGSGFTAPGLGLLLGATAPCCTSAWA